MITDLEIYKEMLERAHIPYVEIKNATYGFTDIQTASTELTFFYDGSLMQTDKLEYTHHE